MTWRDSSSRGTGLVGGSTAGYKSIPEMSQLNLYEIFTPNTPENGVFVGPKCWSIRSLLQQGNHATRGTVYVTAGVRLSPGALNVNALSTENAARALRTYLALPSFTIARCVSL